MSNLGVCPIGAGAPRLHQHRVHDGAKQAPRGEERPCDDRPFHEVHPCGSDKGPDCKTVVKVFYEHFIAVFGVPMKLLSDRGANFTSALVEELCAAFGIQECRTKAYHAQCNGQVECFHQMLFCMIGKLAHNKKAQWEQHLPELLQAYNSTRSVATGYSPHYLMFGRCPHLPIDYYFPMVSTFECSHHVPTYVTEVRRWFKEAYAEAHLQTNCEAKKQKWYYD